MSSQFDILIRNCRLRGRPDTLFEIAVADGKIQEIAEKVDGSAAEELDAQGNLVTESFVNTHLHLCKVYTLEMMDEEAMRDYHGADMGKAFLDSPISRALAISCSLLCPFQTMGGMLSK